MKKLNIDEIKAISFEVLCLVKKVCEENNISYSLTGGTLIGAVRHKGFIPWDDDIDIMIPRPDYDRFIEIVKNGDYGFDLFCAEIQGKEYGYPFAKACARGTVVKEKNVQINGREIGVYVDIFPVDGMGDRFAFAKIRCMLFQFIHGLKITSNWTEYHRSKLRKWYYEPFRYICYIISKMLGKNFINKTLDKFVRLKTFEKSEFAGRMVGDFGSKEIMPKKIFLEMKKAEFEGETFDIIADYDTFLTGLYGNYMQLPPVKKQVSHHEFEAYQVD